MRVLILIPSRFDSTRLPGKPLLKIGNHTVIQRVFLESIKSKATDVFVATDDLRILNSIKEIKGNGVTTGKHLSGTSRIIEAYDIIKNNYDIIINVQGDEPFISKQILNDLIESTKRFPDKIHTVVSKLESDDYRNPNVVKCLLSNNDINMFTRAPLYNKQRNIFKHNGIYAFPRKIFETIINLNDISINEYNCNLEQLRWLDNNIEMRAIYTHEKLISIDTEEDYDKAVKYYVESSR